MLEISSVWDKHYGEMCVGINWEMFTCEDIKVIVSTLIELLKGSEVKWANPKSTTRSRP